MDGILNIFQILSEVDAIQLPKYLNALVEHQSFRQKVSLFTIAIYDGTLLYSKKNSVQRFFHRPRAN